MEHLQGMGDSNACVGRLGYIGSDVLLATAAVYQHAYGSEWASDYQQPQNDDELHADNVSDEFGEEDQDPEFELEDADASSPPSQDEAVGTSGEATEDDEAIDDATSDPTIPCTFQSIHMIGWKEHESQQVPLERGSAQRSLKEIASVSSDDFK